MGCFKCASLTGAIEETPGRLIPYGELDAVLTEHASVLRRVLNDDLIGVYTLGSPATGGFDLTSDVDLTGAAGGAASGGRGVRNGDRLRPATTAHDKDLNGCHMRRRSAVA